jgi:hypothetical protein
MASASSRMISLKFAVVELVVEFGVGAAVKICLVEEKVLICSLVCC